MTRLDHTGCNFIDENVRLGTGSAVEGHHIIGAASWKKGATAPGEGFIILFPTLDFADGANDAAHYVIHVPYRRKAGANMVVHLNWAHDTVAKTGKVLWNLIYRSRGEGDNLDVGGITISVLTAGDHPQKTMIHSEFTTEILSANLTDNDDLALIIRRNGADLADTLTEAARLVSVHVHFTMDKFGNDI